MVHDVRKPQRIVPESCQPVNVPSGFCDVLSGNHNLREKRKEVPGLNGTLTEHAAGIGAGAVGEIGVIFFRPASVEALVDYCPETAAAAPDLPLRPLCRVSKGQTSAVYQVYACLEIWTRDSGSAFSHSLRSFVLNGRRTPRWPFATYGQRC